MSTRGEAARECAEQLEQLERVWEALREEWARAARDWTFHPDGALVEFADRLEALRLLLGGAVRALRAYELELVRSDNPGAARAANEVVGSRLDRIELGFNEVYRSVWNEQHSRRARAAVVTVKRAQERQR